MDAPFGSWGTQTFIAGLTQSALIAPRVIKGAVNGCAFTSCIRDALAPELASGAEVTRGNLAPTATGKLPGPCGNTDAGSSTCPNGEGVPACSSTHPARAHGAALRFGGKVTRLAPLRLPADRRRRRNAKTGRSSTATQTAINCR